MTKYSVVQYVPDPIADERINIGVIAVGEDGAFGQFLRYWTRVARFGHEDIQFLRDFAKATGAQLSGKQSQLDPKLDVERLELWATDWANTIQLTEPRGTLESAEDAVAAVAKRVLKAPRKRERGRTRIVAVNHGRAALSQALESRKRDPDEYLQQKVTLSGEYDAHEFDIGVANGTMIAVARGLSFDVKIRESLDKELTEVKWAIDDIRRVDEGTRLAVLAIPQASRTRLIDQTMKTVKGLGGTLILDDSIDEWAEETVSLL